jgi:hypothetical protein
VTDDVQPRSIAGPIITKSRWSGKVNPPQANVAIVVVYAGNEYRVLWPRDRRRVLLPRRPLTIYEVDLGLHHTTITADLPSRDPTGYFNAELRVAWRVLDPSAIARYQVADVQQTLTPDLLYRARKIAREFGVDQYAAAEAEINKRLDSPPVVVADPPSIQQALQDANASGNLGAEWGLWIKVVAQLTLDEASRERNAGVTKRAIEEEAAQHRFRVLREESQRQIMADRIAVYRRIVQAADREAFAMQLSLHPTDVAAIAKILKDEEVGDRRETIDFVTGMVDSGVIERWEASDQVREALQWLSLDPPRK